MRVERETELRKRGCLFGAFLGDALAMPVHWYYDRAALERDYGRVTDLVAPRNPHADSILWRSSYVAPNAKGEILHDQAKYWGQRGVHYHQFLRAGENTLNMQLAVELLGSLRACGGYDRGDYLRRYIDFLTTPGRHRDTYLEECHRNFFTKYARGKKPEDCGGDDIHIGGLAHVPILAVWYADDERAALEAVREHVRVTHRGELVETAARDLTKMLIAIIDGAGVRESIEKFGNGWVGRKKLEAWSAQRDEEVVGAVLSPACYLEDSFPASLFLAWKYADNLEAALVANTNLGGDNCHRGIVVGALVGAGGAPVPERWERISLPGFARVKHLLLAAVLCASGCVSKPDLPADIRKETRRVQFGTENISVDFYYRADSKPRPMAVIVHGFLANKERMAHWGVILAREGFLAAVPTNPTRANDDRNTAAIVGLVRAGRAGQWPSAARNDGRVVLVGFSRGGFEAILAAAELGDAIDAWVGLDPVDRNGKGKTAATNVRAPGLALLADPAPLNANGNAHGMLKHYAGPLEMVHVPETGHLDAESPQRKEKFAVFEENVLGFLRRVFEL